MRRLLRENWYRDVWLLITTGLVLWAIVLTYSTADESHRSLCVLRADLQHRVDGSLKFLAEHPRGAFGFTPREIRSGLEGQQRTIAALRALNCPKP